MYTELAWDIHTDNQPEGNGLSVLADSDKGLMVLETGNAIGVRFFVTKRCPESIALLDAFVAAKHANMIDREYLDLSAQHAYFDEDHPLQVHYKPSQMNAVKVRPASAPVKRSAPKSSALVNPLKQQAESTKESAWTQGVRPQVKELGKVSSTPPRPFSAKATVPASAKPSKSRPSTGVSRSTRPQSGTTRRSRITSATSRQTIKTARERPETANSRNTFQQQGVSRRRVRPMSAVSLGGVSIIEEDEGEFDDDDDEYEDLRDHVSVDEDDGKTMTSGAASESGWRHPASVLSSRMV